MKIKMIILALMIVGSVAISNELIKNDQANFKSLFNGELEILAERVGS